MKSLLFYFLQTIICSGILYGYYYTALRNKKFHLYNRYYLLFAAAVSIIIPLLNIPVYFAAKPDQSFAFVQVLTVFSPDNTQPVITTEGSTIAINSFFNWENILKILYSVVVLVIFIRFLMAIFHINKLVKKYVAERIDHIYFINTEEPGTPFSFFKWLFWNKKIELNSEKGEKIFRHELFHIRQKHSLDIIFFEMLTAVFWINPFFHFFKKEIKAIHEFLADEFAIIENEEWNYAELLLMQVLKSPNHLLNPFFHNQIKRRIAMITSSKKPGYQYLRKIMVLPVAAIIIALFAFKYKEIKSNAQWKVNFQDSIKPGAKNALTPDTVKLGFGNADNRSVHFNGIALEDKNGKIVNIPPVTLNEVKFAIKDTSKPLDGMLFVINGKERPDIKSLSGIDSIIKPNDISSINVLKGPSALANYGEKGKNGVLEIFTKDYPQTDALKPLMSLFGTDIRANSVVMRNPAIKTRNSIILPDLIIFNKKEYSVDAFKNKVEGGRVEAKFVIIVPPNNSEDIKKYGDRAKNGVVIFEEGKIIKDVSVESIESNIRVDNIIDQKVDSFSVNEKTIEINNQIKVDNIIFEKVEVEPSFPGGEAAWRKFLEKNLKPSVPSKNGAPNGAYTVWIQVTVDKEGNLSDLKALTKFGYGMEEECLRVMKLSPKWLPAKQNGHVVTARKKQRVDFVVNAGKEVTKTIINTSAIKDYDNPFNWDYHDPEFINWRRQAISEIKASARKEGKAAYIYKGRTYIFGRINNPDPTIASFAEQDGTNHAFLLNDELVTSIDEINKRFTRNDIIKLGLISKEESVKRFNLNDIVVSIETLDNKLITKK
jgi:TonB-dependent SusC/RagA subfamily outer membrane receptor